MKVPRIALLTRRRKSLISWGSADLRRASSKKPLKFSEFQRITLMVEILDRGLEDILQLSEIVWLVSKRFDRRPHDAVIKEPTLTVNADLLSAGYVIAGDVKRNTDDLFYFHSWDLDAPEAVARIAREWAELARIIHQGERPGLSTGAFSSA